MNTLKEFVFSMRHIETNRLEDCPRCADAMPQWLQARRVSLQTGPYSGLPHIKFALVTRKPKRALR